MKRLTVEPLSLRHLHDMTLLHSDPEVSRHLGGTWTPEETRAYLEVNIAHREQHGFGLCAVRTPDGAFAGRAGLRRTEVESVAEIEIVYTLKRSAWGRGLGTDVAQALVSAWLKQELSASLIGITTLDNAPSRRVLAKVGFAFEREAIFHEAPVAVYRLERSAASRQGP